MFNAEWENENDDTIVDDVSQNDARTEDDTINASCTANVETNETDFQLQICSSNGGSNVNV